MTHNTIMTKPSSSSTAMPRLLVVVLMAMAAWHSSAELSDTCVSETLGFQANSGLNESLVEMLDRYHKKFQNECLLNFQTERTCEFRYGDDDISEVYNLKCQVEGGQIYQHPLTFKCGIDPASWSFDLGWVPQCVSLACPVNDTLVGRTFNHSEIDEFVDSFDYAGCKAEIDVSGGATIYNHGMVLLASTTIVGVAMWAIS